MWDPRYPQLAADRLAQRRSEAAQHARTPAAGPGPLRRHLGALLVRLGERLAPAPGRPAAVCR